MKQRNPSSRRSAFTLVEILVVLTLTTFISIGLVAFIFDASRGIKWAVNKSRITTDVRVFTTRIVNEAFDANAIYVYKSFSAADRSSVGDRLKGSLSGDCMVLVETAPYADVKDESGVSAGTDADKYYRSIVVYYRRPDAQGEGPVYRVSTTFSPARKAEPDDFETVLAERFGSGSPSSEEVVLELARGKANKQLFRASTVEGYIIINGEILHGTESVREKDVTNTYNLTITSRG